MQRVGVVRSGTHSGAWDKQGQGECRGMGHAGVSRGAESQTIWERAGCDLLHNAVWHWPEACGAARGGCMHDPRN